MLGNHFRLPSFAATTLCIWVIVSAKELQAQQHKVIATVYKLPKDFVVNFKALRRQTLNFGLQTMASDALLPATRSFGKARMCVKGLGGEFVPLETLSRRQFSIGLLLLCFIIIYGTLCLYI